MNKNEIYPDIMSLRENTQDKYNQHIVPYDQLWNRKWSNKPILKTLTFKTLPKF